MEQTQPARRIGVIKVDKQLWTRTSHAIRKTFSDSMILDVKENAEAVDIVLINPNFTEVCVSDFVPIYICDVMTHDDGSISRGAITAVK